MLQKGVYSYKNMDDWKTFIKTSEKEDFCSHPNTEDITDGDNTHARRICKDFKNNEFTKILWFAYAKWYIIVSGCILKLRKCKSWNIWAWSYSFSFWLAGLA